MVDVRPQAFEHPATGTFVCLRRSGVQFIRNGVLARQRVARTLSRDRSARFLVDSDLYDVEARSFPNPAYSLKAPGQLLPSGHQVLQWHPTEARAYIEPNTGRKLVGLICVDLTASSGEIWWQPTEQTPGLENADLHVASDGKTWALVAGQRMQVGQDTTPLLYHEDREPLERLTFDLVRSRVLTSFSRNRRGILSLPLKRSAHLAWSGWLDGDAPDVLPVVSPVAVAGDELMAVVRQPSPAGKLARYEVWRFHETLKPLGRHEGFPRCISMGDDQIVLPLSDGSFAWFVDTDRILLSRATGVEHITTDLVRVVDEWSITPEGMDGTLDNLRDHGAAHMGAFEKLSPAKRRVLARYLIDCLVDGPRRGNELALFEQLLAFDPTAFAAHGDGVVRWSDERVERFARAAPRTYWQAARGASNEAVGALVRRIRSKLPTDEAIKRTANLAPDAERLVMLLGGVDSDESLKQIGELGREFFGVEAAARQANLDVVESGPAERRFTLERQLLIARPAPPKNANPHIRALHFKRPTRDDLERPQFHDTDLLPRISLLALDASLILGKTQAFTRQPVHEVIYYGSRYYNDPSDTWDTFEAYSHNTFEVKLQPADAPVEPGWRAIGVLGGRPEWLVEPAVPYCAHCGITLHYVGAVRAAELLGEGRDETLFSFRCVWCGDPDTVPQRPT